MPATTPGTDPEGADRIPAPDQVSVGNGDDGQTGDQRIEATLVSDGPLPGSDSTPSNIAPRDNVTIDESIAGNTYGGRLENGGASRFLVGKQNPQEKYSLGEVVAKGGMGAIIEARDINVRRNVAMKKMLDAGSATEKKILRFIEEAQITGQLEHPGVVPVHELGVDADGELFYTMKFVRGLTLDDIIKGIARGDQAIIDEYPLGRLLNVFLKVCETIAFAHSKSVLHRDLKPENVMVGHYGEVLVMDWGLAKVLAKDRLAASDSVMAVGNSPPAGEDNAVEEMSLETIDSVRTDDYGDAAKTMHGDVLGTPAYMPPEQAQGDIDNLDERADIYSLGAILYSLLTLEKPVTGSTPIEVLLNVAKGNIVHPRELSQRKAKKLKGDKQGRASGLPHVPQNRVPESLAAVMMKALSQNKVDRYATVQDLQAEIEAYQSGFATQAEQAGTLKQAMLFVRRNRTMTAGISAVVVALAVGMTAAMLQWRKAVAAQQTTEKTLSQLESEQLAREKVSKRAAPEFVQKSQDLVKQNQPDQAMSAIETALGLDAELASAWFEKGRLYMAQYEFQSATSAFERAIALNSDDGNMMTAAKSYIQLADKYQPLKAESPDGLLVERVMTLAADIDAQGDPVIAGLLYGRVGERQLQLQLRVRAAFEGMEKVNPGLEFRRDEKFHSGFYYFYWHHAIKDDGLHLGFPKINDYEKFVNISPLANLPIRSLDITGTHVSDISPLSGMPLDLLRLERTKIVGLNALEGMKIRSLYVGVTKITDLTPLTGMPLETLSLNETKVSDLSPLQGLPLQSLNLNHCDKVVDLTPLRGMKLKELNIENTAVEDLSPIEGMPLEELSVACHPIQDISPLAKVSPKILRVNYCRISNLDALKGKQYDKLSFHAMPIDDFSALREIRAKEIGISHMGFRDLNLVGHMPLEYLGLSNTPKVTDLSPLAGMKLTRLSMDRAGATDLSPLKGLPLTDLTITLMPVRDIGALRGMRLKRLEITKAEIDDISVIRGMPITELNLIGCKNLNDLTPIKDLEDLVEVYIPEHCRDIDFLRDMKSVQRISNNGGHAIPAAEFWEKFDSEKQ